MNSGLELWAGKIGGRWRSVGEPPGVLKTGGGAGGVDMGDCG